ncbi:XRE family transcriptional regulator [Caballeronia sp. INDeC2]|uniref:XRE family transcriptional regulator n=1 Tax=Caballeronia sp. INDeC2 TaxID=2921747 RepID=UPI002028A906|nr:XRE family transcriptional regulator [Caballeronia sp. INDeC2]
MKYKPPSPEDLVRLKEALGYSSAQMADLFGVATGRQWRRYTSKPEDPTNHRDMSLQMLFFATARLELDQDTFERILDRMRAYGAHVDLSADGNPQQ